MLHVMTIRIPIEAGNAALRDPDFGKKVNEVLTDIKPHPLPENPVSYQLNPIPSRKIQFPISISKYDGMTGSSVNGGTAITNGAGSSQWKEIIFRISDGYFGRRGIHGCDVKLVRTSGSADCIFHLIEVRRTLSGGGNPFP